MYLSRIILDTNKPETAQAIYRPARFHGAIESCFSGGRAHALWRLDLDGHLGCMYILSHEIPDLSRFHRDFGVECAEPGTVPYDGFLKSLQPDRLYHFRITVSPVVKIENKRIPMVFTGRSVHGNASSWLAGRLNSRGFFVEKDDFMLVGHRYVRMKRNSNHEGGGYTISYTEATFDGVLRIADVAAATEMLTKGLGSEKAFGCGLMTLMPAE